MIKNVSVNQLLLSDLFVKVPVDEVNNCYSSYKNRKFILVGGRGCGKSTVLASKEINSINSAHPAILTSFESTGLFDLNGFTADKSVIEHYYEIVMCSKFLNHISEYYPKLFFSKFNKLDTVINSKLAEFDNYIHNGMYDNVSIDHKFSCGELLNEIIYMFRHSIGCRSLTLMIDRFDWIHNSEPKIQEILKKYFKLFEEVILTSDDSTITTDRNKKAYLRNRCYQLINVSYSKDPDFVTDIVERRFDLDKETCSKFPIERIKDEDYLRLIERCDGNLDMILDTFLCAETLHQRNISRNLSDIVDDAWNVKNSSVNAYKKVYNSPKLHL